MTKNVARFEIMNEGDRKIRIAVLDSDQFAKGITWVNDIIEAPTVKRACQVLYASVGHGADLVFDPTQLALINIKRLKKFETIAERIVAVLLKQ